MLESKISDRDDPEFVHCKEENDKLYEGKINGAIIRSMCDWYEHGKNFQRFS